MLRNLLCLIAIFLISPSIGTSNQAMGPASLTPKEMIGPAMLYATGEGAMANAKEQPNRAKAYLAAKSYAKMQAIASVLQLAKGTIIEYTAKGDNYLAETKIKQQIKGVLGSVQVVGVSKRSVDKDIIVAVTVRAPKPVPPKLPDISSDDKFVSSPKPCKPTWLSSDKTETASRSKSESYTSLIVDTQGLGVSRSMSPKLVRSDGSEVWGTIKTDFDFISDYGIVAYANSRAEAYASRRAGENPLVIRAIGVAHSPTNGDVIVSPADASVIEKANQKSGFLQDFRVIIIVDRVSNIRSFASSR